MRVNPERVQRVSAWWRTELVALRTSPARGARVARWLFDRPSVALLPAAAIGPGLFGAAIPWGDAGWFREAGLSMLGPGFFDVFSAAGLQIGPVYLLLVGALAAVVDLLSLPALFTVAAVQSVGLTVYTLFLVRRFARELGAAPLPAQWGVGVPVVFFGVLSESIGNGHPEEFLLALLLAHGVLVSRHGRPAAFGGILGAAVGLKLWAVLGAPVVLLDRRWRSVLVAGSIAVAMTLAWYLPFHLAGEVNTFDFSWGTGPAPFGLRAVGGALSGWGFRLVQAAVVIALGALVAWRWPGSGLGVVLTVVTVRVVLAPMLQMYYTIPFVVVALLWLWTAPSRSGTAWRIASWPATLLAMLGPYVVDLAVRLPVTHIAMTIATVAIVRADHRSASLGPDGKVPGEEIEVNRTR